MHKTERKYNEIHKLYNFQYISQQKTLVPAPS